MRKIAGIALVAVIGTSAGCAANRVDERPIIRNGDRVALPHGEIEDERVRAAEDDEEWANRRALLEAEALATCVGDVCEAVTRGEVALGMNEVQVLAATGTTEEAWSTRRSGGATVMTPRWLERPPRDAAGDLALVRIEEDGVASYAYREGPGVRLVSEPDDATTEGRAEALGEMLLREGDELAAAGRLDLALDRYDRAQVLRPADPLVDYRIATVLDKQLRPIEALIQYRLFLHRLELERIEARGVAAGRLADAIAQARQRVIVLEREGR